MAIIIRLLLPDASLQDILERLPFIFAVLNPLDYSPEAPLNYGQPADQKGLRRAKGSVSVL